MTPHLMIALALGSAALLSAAGCGGGSETTDDGPPSADSGTDAPGADAGRADATVCAQTYVSLDGSDGSRVEVVDPLQKPNPFLLFYDDTFTVELWVKFAEDGSSRAVVERRGIDSESGELNAGWAVDIGPTWINAVMFGKFSNTLRWTTPITGWHHVTWMMKAVDAETAKSVVALDGSNNPSDLESRGCDGIAATSCQVPLGTVATLTDIPVGLGVLRNDDGSVRQYEAGGYDDLRISTGARYSLPFTPERPLTADGDTLALFRFDEGLGAASADDIGPYTAELSDSAAWSCDP